MGDTTLLHLAARHGEVAEVGRILSASSADLEAKDEDGATPLMEASFNGHLAVVEALAGAGAEKEVKDEEGCTALILASAMGHLTVVEVLVRAGADVTTAAANGKTAELFARDRGHTAVADLLHRHLEEEKAEQAMESLLLLDDDAGTGTSDGQGQAAKKAKSKKTKKAKQKLRESKAQHAAAAGAALAAAQQAQQQAKDRERQQRVREELLQNRAEAAAQEQEFKRLQVLQETESTGCLKRQEQAGGGSRHQLQGKRWLHQVQTQQQVQLPLQDTTCCECHKCTVLNPPLAQVCSVCNTARVHVHPAVQQQQQQPDDQQPVVAPAGKIKELAHVECSRCSVGEPVELLECPICIECYAAPPSENAPMVLPCGHSICRRCAEDLQAAALRSSKGGGLLSIACPSCCRQLDLPQGGVKSLPVNYALVQAAQAIKDAALKMSERERTAAPAAALAAPAAAPARKTGKNAAAAAPASPTATTDTGTGVGASGGGSADGSSGAGGDDGASGGGIGLAGLLQQLQFTSAQIADYVPALTEAGYDLIEDLAAVTMEELMEDAGMKKPHARRITTHFSQ